MKNLLLLSIAVSMFIACNTTPINKEIQTDPDKDYTVIKVVEEETMPLEIVYPSYLNSPAGQTASLPLGEIRMGCSVNYKVKISKNEILITNESDAVLEKYSLASVKELDYGGAGGVLKSYTEYDAIDKAQQKIKIIQITGIDSSYSYIQFKGNNKVRTLSVTKTQGPLISMAQINVPIYELERIKYALEKGTYSIRGANK